METKTINWETGGGTFTVTYGGSGDGTIVVTSDANTLHEARSQSLTVKTTKGGTAEKTITIAQAMKPYIDLTNAVVTAANQTYSGSALTPVPTVTLNGETIPSTGYDVTYSNNTNAGTASITITGKDDYTGTTTGTFTIARASRTLSFSNPTTVVAPSGNVTNTATPSAGASDGTITYSISSTTYATINSSTGKVTAKTSEGSATVTATISEGTNYLSASASYIIRVFNTVHAFAYTGNVQSLNLPAGSYKLQVWGAQGGSNAADSSYGITAQVGGKGGYSDGIITISEDKTVYVFVGGQGGSSGNGGWNGGGGGYGSSSYNTGGTNGVSRFGCGGGATDIALVTSNMAYYSYRTNRSSESLLSRIIVAGGGSGGAMCYRGIISTVTDYSVSGSRLTCKSTDSVSGKKVTLTGGASVASPLLTLTPTHEEVEEARLAQVGSVGGGTSGGGYSSTYQGKQNAAGYGGGFGYGANQKYYGDRYCSACGGGGWYGGGGGISSDYSMTYCEYSGGGSGWVNISASASNRPSGYTGLELDSGTTYDGSKSFPNTTETGNETGHSGDGYAKITRIS